MLQDCFAGHVAALDKNLQQGSIYNSRASPLKLPIEDHFSKLSRKFPSLSLHLRLLHRQPHLLALHRRHLLIHKLCHLVALDSSSTPLSSNKLHHGHRLLRPFLREPSTLASFHTQNLSLENDLP